MTTTNDSLEARARINLLNRPFEVRTIDGRFRWDCGSGSVMVLANPGTYSSALLGTFTATTVRPDIVMKAGSAP